MDNWFPEWHYLDKGDYPPDNLFVPLIIQDDTGDYYIRYWREDAQWWDHPTIGWLPHLWGADGDCEMVITRWSFMPTVFYETDNKCDCYFTRENGEGHCFGTKELDICACQGNTRFCDFYDYMRRR